jgi:hypothetical protein
MKVICIKCANTEYYKLTINKIYECFLLMSMNVKL